MKHGALTQLGKRDLFAVFSGLALLAVSFLIYWPSLRGEWIWDDFFLVAENPLIRSPILLLEIFRHYLLPDMEGRFYRPIQNGSFIFDYWRGGLSPVVFHQTNIFLHGANAVWLLLLSRRWLVRLGGVREAGWPALLIALIWLVHPTHNAAVAYISGRADSLALFFLLAGWWCWEKALESPRRGLFAGGAFIAAFLAVGSKEMALVGLLVFGVYLWFFRPELTAKVRGATSLGVLLVGAVYWAMRLLPQAAEETGGASTLWSERPNLILRALGDYARILIFPKRLLMERQIVDVPLLLHSPALSDSFFPYLGWLGGGLIGVLLLAAVYPGKTRGLRRFGALWFGIAICPVSNLFPLNATVAEHWLYLPSIGFFLLLLGVLLDLSGQKTTSGMLLLLLCAFSLGARTWRRAEDWARPKQFYEAAIRDGGDSIRIRLNLAADYRMHHDLKTSEAILRSILARVPSYAAARQSLALNLREQGRNEEADALFQENLRRKNLTQAEKTLAWEQLTSPGDQVLQNLRAGFAANPASWRAARALAGYFQQKNQPQVAIEVLRGFCDREWWQYAAHLQLGTLLAENGATDGALSEWRLAAALDIRDVNALDFAADLLAATGKTEDAVQMQKRAIGRLENREQWNLLAKIYENAGRSEEALAAQKRGVEFR